MPEPLRERPVLLEPLFPVWDAFWDLNSERTVEHVASLVGAFSVRGPIPYRARAAWLDDHGIEGDERAWFERLLLRMDQAFAEHQSERMRAQANDEGDDGE